MHFNNELLMKSSDMKQENLVLLYGHPFVMQKVNTCSTLDPDSSKKNDKTRYTPKNGSKSWRTCAILVP